jgi:hypothetical protein
MRLLKLNTKSENKNNTRHIKWASTVYIFILALNMSVRWLLQVITSKIPLCFFLVLFQIQLGHCMSNQHRN